ncbi:glycosyltransferase family 2 protein [Acinetobacter bereziniae]|uniref:glycosyltransferase family 2 protein n=1 Tax=Acinetobacter bereziniae TaxID=106648 RepID=UPI002074B3E9|nr:glycosyltransferase family A protein [Acinetobacter bereziniae]MCM8512866.1 glycosyltransferase family 2 protein [Acinetobacter bereziniae]
MITPLVSIVIPCYNHECFIQDCIISVLDQTYQNIELIIIDDGSHDDSIKRIQEMLQICKQRFVRFEFRYRQNKGLSATLNEALEWCQGEYYSTIASDDILIKDKIEKQINIFLKQDKDILAIMGSAYLINENNEIIGSDEVFEDIIYDFDEIFMHQHRLLAPTQLIKSQAIKDVGGYKDNMIIEDWYMWLKLTRNGKILAVPDFFVKYRQHENNTTKQLEKMHQGRLQLISQFQHEKLYDKALFNVYWINSMEDLRFSSKNKLKVIFKLFIKSPNLFFHKFFKKIKEKI